MAEKLREFINKNKTLVLWLAALAVISYGYELFNFSLSGDEEFASFSSALRSLYQIGDGRWATYLINLFLLPHSVIPYFPTLIAILCIAAVAFLFINHVKCDPASKFVFAAIFISYPIHCYYLAFNHQAIGVGIGMIAAIAGYLLVYNSLGSPRPDRKLMLISAPVLAFSFGTYQSIIPVFIILALAHILVLLMNDENTAINPIVKRAAVFAGTFLMALVLYRLIDVSVKTLFGIFDPSVGERAYRLEGFWQWGRKPFMTVLEAPVRGTMRYLSGTYYYNGFSMKAIILPVLLILYSIIGRKTQVLRKLMSAATLGALILSPFLMMFALGRSLPPYSMCALPLMLGAVWWCAYQYSGARMRKLIVILACLFFLHNTYTNTRLFYLGNVTWQADRDIANRMIERIYALDLPKGSPTIKVAFIGKYSHPKNELFFWNEVYSPFGASFFDWEGGEPGRMVSFFKTIGIANFEPVPYGKDLKQIEFIKAMPCWPAKGSVALYTMGVVIVKLSDVK